jgi:hypothetical protein
VTSTYTTFIGIDLGGARGKTTAVARISAADTDTKPVAVEEVTTRRRDERGVEHPWCDEALLAYLDSLDPNTCAIAINAPLTMPACVRCQLSVCPGVQVCEVASVAWLRSAGAELVEQAFLADRDRIAAIPMRTALADATSARRAPRTKARIAPYTHRVCEVRMHHERGLLPRGHLGMSTGPIAARASHLRRVLAGRGFGFNENLIEVSPRATVHALFGARKARGYKRDADPWETRAAIVESLDDIRFAPTSRLSKEEVLRNDHCFEALLSAYTGYLRERDGWTLPTDADPEMLAADGWIWAPPT